MKKQHRIPFYRWAMATSTVTGMILAGGCAIYDDPVYQSVTRSIEDEPFDDKTRSYQVGWLAQAMLEPQARNDIAKKLIENAPQIAVTSKFAQASDLAIGTQMAADLATGQLGSVAGKQLSPAVFVGVTALSVFTGDGSLDVTQVVLLPDRLDGQTIDTPETAKKVAQKMMVDRYALAAEKTGYDFYCEYSCDAFPSVYRLQRKPETDVAQFIYAANTVAVYFVDFELFAPEKTKAIDSLAAGFNVAWRTPYDNTAGIYTLQDPVLDENGKIKILPSDSMKSGWTVAGNLKFAETDFGEAYLREVYKTPYMLFGDGRGYPSVAYYNGVVYKNVLNSAADSFDRIVLPARAQPQ